MSDLASNCGCGCNTPRRGEGGCSSIIWLILLLSCCGNNNSICNSGCGNTDNNCLWLIILLFCCGGCGNNSFF